MRQSTIYFVTIQFVVSDSYVPLQITVKFVVEANWFVWDACNCKTFVDWHLIIYWIWFQLSGLLAGITVVKSFHLNKLLFFISIDIVIKSQWKVRLGVKIF